MRHALLGLAALVAVAVWAPDSRAQGGTFDDPFFAYYGFFLPRQAALAAQPRVQDTINQNFADNQVYARTNRSTLSDPSGGYSAFDNYDPDAAFSGNGLKRSRSAMSHANPTGHVSRAPGLYYNRAAQYYPTLRSGIGPNRNLAVSGRGVRGGGAGRATVPSAAAGMNPGFPR